MAVNTLQFSLIIPVFNEEESVKELLRQIETSLKKLNATFEIIFIDDGSTDNTLDILKKLAEKNKHIYVYAFRRNLGKSPALSLGFQKAKGQYIVTLDGDLQDDPQNIALLFRKMKEENFDLVSGWRQKRKDNFTKVVSSRFFNFLVSRMFGLKMNDLNCGLKLYKSDLAKELHLYGGMHRFIPIISNEMGFSISEVPIVHHERKFGHSKYKSTKILTDIPDLITIYFLTKYTRRPLHFFSKIGGILFTIGLVVLLYLTTQWIGGHPIGRRPLLTFGVLFVIAGIQTIFTGLLADLFVNLDHKNGHDFPIKYQSVN